MGRNLYKLTKIPMTLSKRDSLKSRRFSKVFAEYLKNSSTDFHQTYLIFRQSSIDVFEIKRLKTAHSLLPW